MKNHCVKPKEEGRLDSERLRLETLEMLGLLDPVAERDFDVLVSMARRTLGCSVALLSLVGSDRLLFKASAGVQFADTPREHSFCSTAVALEEPLIVPDASVDPRFAEHPLVKGAPHIRFYAGVPIRAKISYGSDVSVAIGTVCVVDEKTRVLSAEELASIADIAHLVESIIDARLTALFTAQIADESEGLVRSLYREQRQLKQAERMANIGSWRLVLGKNRAEWSDQVFAIHQLPVGQMPPLEKALDFYPPHARETVSAAIERALQTGEPFEVETDFITAKANARRVRCLGEVEIRDGTPVALIGVFQDVTARYHMEQSLRRIAGTDDLTQLANRAQFNLVLDERLDYARAHNETLALLLIDLDGFKAINDQCGHLAGDDLLRLIGERLKAPYLSRCFVARLGGDEFVVVVSDPADVADFENLLSRLLSDLVHTVTKGKGLLHISGSIGICWLDDTVTSRSDLVQRADVALYAAKQTQRGTAQAHVPEKWQESLGL